MILQPIQPISEGDARRGFYRSSNPRSVLDFGVTQFLGSLSHLCFHSVGSREIKKKTDANPHFKLEFAFVSCSTINCIPRLDDKARDQIFIEINNPKSCHNTFSPSSQ